MDWVDIILHFNGCVEPYVLPVETVSQLYTIDSFFRNRGFEASMYEFNLIRYSKPTCAFCFTVDTTSTAIRPVINHNDLIDCVEHCHLESLGVAQHIFDGLIKFLPERKHLITELELEEFEIQ
jgi:hypothetical protein